MKPESAPSPATSRQAPRQGQGNSEAAFRFLELHRRSARAALLLAGAGILALVAASTGGQRSAQWVGLVLLSPGIGAATAATPPPAGAGISLEMLAAARKEGEVTYYTADELPHANKLKAVFEARHGIKVNVLRSSSTLLYNRVVQEFDTGVNAADILMTAVIDHFDTLKSKAMLQPFTPASINLYANPTYYDAAHYWHAIRLAPSTINYNRNLVKGDMIPKTWKDLADPKYKDKLAQGNPKASGASAVIDYNLVKLYGWQYFEALKKNNIMTQQSCSQPNLISSGERLMIPCDYGTTAAARLQNLPIESVFPQDGVFVILSPVAILAKAPHPNAAKVFLDWLVSPEGQTLYTQGGLMSPLDSDEVKYPADFPDRKSMKLINTNAEEFRKWMPGGLEKFADLFGG